MTEETVKIARFIMLVHPACWLKPARDDPDAIRRNHYGVFAAREEECARRWREEPGLNCTKNQHTLWPPGHHWEKPMPKRGSRTRYGMATDNIDTDSESRSFRGTRPWVRAVTALSASRPRTA